MELTNKPLRRLSINVLEFRKNDQMYEIVPIYNEQNDEGWWTVVVLLNGAKQWSSDQKNERFKDEEAATQRGFEYVKSVTKFK